MTKPSSLALLILLTLSAASAPADPPATAPAMTEFRDAEHEVVIDYPSQWEKAAASSPMTVCTFMAREPSDAEPFRDNLNVVYARLPQRLEMNVMSEAAKKGILKQMPAAKFLEDADTTLDGRPAHKFVYVAKLKHVDMQATQVITLDKTDLFQVTIATTPARYDAFKPTTDAILASVKIRRGK